MQNYLVTGCVVQHVKKIVFKRLPAFTHFSCYAFLVTFYAAVQG